MDGRKISKMESPSDCRSERESGKRKRSDLGTKESSEASVFKKWGYGGGGCGLGFYTPACRSSGRARMGTAPSLAS